MTVLVEEELGNNYGDIWINYLWEADLLFINDNTFIVVIGGMFNNSCLQRDLIVEVIVFLRLEFLDKFESGLISGSEKFL